MNYDGLETDQISDGLNETAACASAVVYDKANGLVFVSYMTGRRKSYGESTGRLCLSVFPPSQPNNVRRRVIDEGVGQSRGLLATAHYQVGDGKTRLLFTSTRGEKAAWCRDYDFFSDTVSPRAEVFFRSDEGDVRLDNAAYRAYLAARGLRTESEADPIVNKVTRRNGELYTAVTIDDRGYPILCRIVENLLVPFAVCPAETTYEFRYVVTDEGICGVYRVPPDDHGAGHGGVALSGDGGKTWETRVYADGVQSRPDVLVYAGKPLIVYNFRSDLSDTFRPPMHNSRNAVRMIYEGETVLELVSRYGIVEHETIAVGQDLYMAFSNSPQSLSIENGAAWIEDGRPVEQGKEAVQWMRVGRPPKLESR